MRPCKPRDEQEELQEMVEGDYNVDVGDGFNWVDLSEADVSLDF